MTTPTNPNDFDDTQATHTNEEKGISTVAAPNAMTPITGTNGYQQQVPIDPSQPLLLSVSNASGEVRVSSSDQAGVWVVVRRSDGKAHEEPDIIPVTVSADGNTISVHPDWGVAGGFAGLAKKIKDQLQNGLNTSDWDISKLRLNPDLNYDIRIEIPRNVAAGSRVSAKTASGKLSVSDVTGDVSATTASGKTRLSNITGTVTTTSASGSIEVTDVVGSLEANTASGSVTVNGGEAWTALRTVSGRISVDNFTMKNARLVTVSGGVRASAVVNNSVDYSVTTVSGGVNLDLTIPESSGATMTFKTASGGADVSSAWVAEGRKSWKIGNGQPGPAFNIKTVSGGLQSAAKLDPTLVLRNEPLPNTYEAETEDNEGVTVTGQGGPNADAGFDIDATIENVTGWAKDFAKEFGKGFSSATPPPPAAPEAPTTPVTPDQPAPPVPPVEPMGVDQAQAALDEQRAAADEARAVADERAAAADEALAEAEEHSAESSAQPWTWSTGSGSIPPSGPGSATPVEPATAPIPAATEPAGEDKDAERLRVLEALERGEIDIDEALAKLEPEDAPGA